MTLPKIQIQQLKEADRLFLEYGHLRFLYGMRSKLGYNNPKELAERTNQARQAYITHCEAHNIEYTIDDDKYD